MHISDLYSSRLLRERDESVERRTEFQQSNINEGGTKFQVFGVGSKTETQLLLLLLPGDAANNCCFYVRT